MLPTIMEQITADLEFQTDPFLQFLSLHDIHEKAEILHNWGLKG